MGVCMCDMCGALCSTVLRLVEHFNFVTVHHSADDITVLYAFWLCIINLNVNCIRGTMYVNIVPFRQSFPFYNHSTTATTKLIILHHSLTVTTAVILFSFIFLLCACRSVDAECEYCVHCTAAHCTMLTNYYYHFDDSEKEELRKTKQK